MLPKKVVLITGSGLGFAIGQKFLENGTTTIIADRNVEKFKCCQSAIGRTVCGNALRWT